MCGIVVKDADVVVCVYIYVKMFALTLLSSVKEARSSLHHQRAALGTLTDKVSTATVSTANEQPPSPASVSQSDVSRLFSQYLESKLQVFFLCKRVSE